MRPKLGYFILILSFHLLVTLAEATASRRQALGLGLVGGALIGGSVGHAYAHRSNYSRHHQVYPTTAVNRTGAYHGCYKEVIKERDPNNPFKYRKVVRLVYPTSRAVARVVPARHYNATNITNHVYNASVNRLVPVPAATNVVVISKTKYKNKKSMAYRFVESLMALVICAALSFLL